MNRKEIGHTNPTFVLDENGDKKKNEVDVRIDNIDESDEEESRPVWTSQLEFLFSCLSMSVGLGNVWRFPRVAYENGGGAFIIPYIIVLFLVGRPIYFLELCIGQFSSKTQVKIWRCNPLFKGVGYAAMIGTLFVMTYYCSIIAITIFYFFASFTSELPWKECDPNWGRNGVNCSLVTSNQSFAAELYYTHEVLQEKSNINDGIGYPEWRMSLCLLGAWLFIYFSLIKGIKSSGKVAYFTALFPYAVLITLLIRGLTLEGASIGLQELFNPDFSVLITPKVWYEAVVQCFYSLNTGFGSIIMFSSFNPFRHSIYRDAVILSIMDTITSLIAGTTVFSVLGNLSFLTGKAIPEILETGDQGIAFISYPQAILYFPVPQLFAALFFLMLFTLGIGSAAADAGAVISLLADKFPKFPRWKITTIVAVGSFLFGLVYVTPGGQWIVNLVDVFGVGIVIFIVSILEVVGIAWIYGLNNFVSDIHFMLNIKLGWYWKICWGIIIPLGLCIIFIYQQVIAGELTYNGISYPTIGVVFGWLMAAFSLLPIIFFAGLAIYKANGTSFFDKIKNSIKPTEEWGPMFKKDRIQWFEWKTKEGRL